MAETKRSPEELTRALTNLGVQSEIVERLQGCPEVMELILFVVADDDAQVDRVLAEIREPASKAADHLHADLFRYLEEAQEDLRRPSMILSMRRDMATEAMAMATTDRERAEIDALGNDRSIDYSFSVTFEPDEGGHGIVASAPALPGCHTEGETLDEAREMIKDAILETIFSLIERDEPVPADSTVDTETGKTTLQPEPGQTVEVITVKVEVPIPATP